MQRVLPRLIVLALALVLLPLASDVGSQVVPKLSGLSYIDFRSKPRFKVGDWVRYHFSSKSEDGSSEDYDMTILIGGEERFWDEDGFWVETWSGGRTLPSQSTCYLISYSIFGDPKWLEHLQVYQRKVATRDEDGKSTQDLVHRSLKSKLTTDMKPAITTLVDTLGSDTTTVALGTFRCTKLRRKAGVGTVEDRGDSTFRTENWDVRTLYLSPKVPVTSLVREIDDRWITKKNWKVGKSEDAKQHYALKGKGTLSLVAFGSGDLKPKLTPEYARRPMARSLSASRRRTAKRSS